MLLDHDDPASGRRIDRLARLNAPMLRESAGRHELDGFVPDLSPGGVRRALADLGGPDLDDPHDDAHVRAFEDDLRVRYGEVELHRRNPRPLLAALDLSGYDRPYAPEPVREAAKADHLALWADAIAGGIEALDAVPAPVARGLLASVRGAAVGIDPSTPGATDALAAHARLVAHLERAAEHGDPDPRLGRSSLTRLLGVPEAMELDLGAMEGTADRERRRLQEMLADACGQLDPGREVETVVSELVADHPDVDGVLRRARELTDEVLAFTRDRSLLTDLGGVCEVTPSPPSRRWATAMMAWAAPYEPDGASWYYVTPPDDAWPAQRQREWLSAFSHTTLPSTTAHEVAPGHFSHGRALRQVAGDVRRSLQSSAFVEGWAHYAEELLVEQGFRGDDPRFRIGVALEALLRVTRMAVSIGIHSGTLGVVEAQERFRRHALVRDAVAEAETARATFDPTYGRYTWGKLEILRLREEVRRRLGPRFDLRRFHDELLALGAPPLGLIDDAPRSAQGAQAQ